MKRLLLFLLITGLSSVGFSQTIFQSDPGIGQPFLVDGAGNSVDPNNLAAGQTATLKLLFFNNGGSIIPNGALRLRLGLGTKLGLVSPATVNSPATPLSTYFTFSYVAGSNEIIADQRADIPGGLVGQFGFDIIVTGNTPSTGSNVTANLLVPNTDPNRNLVDNNGFNNTGTMFYKTTIVLPVKFTSIDAKNNNCVIAVNWMITDQLNVASYEVEVSKNGGSFRSAASVDANNGSSYNASFPLTDDIKANMIFVRIKQVDLNGEFAYSEVRAVRGTCDDRKQLIVHGYPNPVTGTLINLGAKEGTFDGKYKLELFDNNGKFYQVKEVQLNNAVSIPFEFNVNLAPGNYRIRITNMDGSQNSTVQFVKLGVL